jgi:hypothetical protein
MSEDGPLAKAGIGIGFSNSNFSPGGLLPVATTCGFLFLELEILEQYTPHPDLSVTSSGGCVEIDLQNN